MTLLFPISDIMQDKVDIMAVLRYLATRCAQIGTDSSQLSAVPIAPEVLSASPPDAIEQFLGWLGDARQIDPAVLDQQLHTINPVLLDSEHAVMGFTAGRDTLVLTTHRVLAIDVQGITGKKVEYQSVPWTKVRGFSATSAGSWDTDAELKFYLKAPWLELHSGCISQDLRKGRADIVAIQSFAAAQTFGACDGSSVVPGSGASDAGSGVVQFLNWLGDNSHQVASTTTTTSTTTITSATTTASTATSTTTSTTSTTPPPPLRLQPPLPLPHFLLTAAAMCNPSSTLKSASLSRAFCAVVQQFSRCTAPQRSSLQLYRTMLAGNGKQRKVKQASVTGFNLTNTVPTNQHSFRNTPTVW